MPLPAWRALGQLGDPRAIEPLIGMFDALETYKKTYSRFSSLSFQYYSLMFNAFELPAQEPVTGDLHDDLADIYCDLKSGLEYWNEGDRENAAFAWQSSFRYHWGSHATHAMVAMHQFGSEE